MIVLRYAPAMNVGVAEIELRIFIPENCGFSVHLTCLVVIFLPQIEQSIPRRFQSIYQYHKLHLNYIEVHPFLTSRRTGISGFQVSLAGWLIREIRQ